MKRFSTTILFALVAVAAACPAPPAPPITIGEGEGEGEEGEGEGEEGEGEGEGEDAFPSCTVRGTAGVSFTRDEGATLAPTETPIGGTVYTYGLVALGDGNLVAEHAGRFLRSRDHGCTWTDLGAAPTTPMRMGAGSGVVYAWADNNREFARIDDDDSVTLLEPPPGAWKGLTVAANGDVIAALDMTLFTSTDDGATFDRGTAPAFPNTDLLLTYRAFFDPKDARHAIFGAATDGAVVTFDGGATWTPATGLSSTGQRRANLFEGVISPLNGDIVWGAGVDIEESLADPNAGKHIYHSEDGGLTWEPILSESAEVTIINGPMMAASPAEEDVFYFVFGTFFQNFGTDVYRVLPDGTFTKEHNGYHDISAVVFAPDDAETMYLGLVNEVIN